MQGEGSVLATKAVDTQGKSSVSAAKAERKAAAVSYSVDELRGVRRHLLQLKALQQREALEQHRNQKPSVFGRTDTEEPLGRAVCLTLASPAAALQMHCL